MALIQIRRGTAAAWTSENPTLEAGEFGLETDTGKTKIGNGATAWTSLTYNYVTYAQVDVTGATNGQALVHNGTKFVPGAVSSTLDSLTDVTAPSPTSGDFLKWNGSAWVNDAIDLGADTTGSFVASLVAGTGITLSNNSGEAATPTVTVNTAVIQARVADVSDTEIGYLNGVTSSIQTQINSLALSESAVDGGNAYTIQFNVLGAVDAMRA